MFTELVIANFKRLVHAEVPLAEAVVFIGPNNSGKTTALQALSLWDIGLRKCLYASRVHPRQQALSLWDIGLRKWADPFADPFKVGQPVAETFRRSPARYC